MVIGSSPLKVIGGFTRLLISGPHGIDRGASKCKLAQTSIIIERKKNYELIFNLVDIF